ncbi:hypothetical protein BDV25DRAFT_93244 [Aspergillus avenaceus]|uniref:Short chain oxidoreductase/dehydrogenase n=1 Tax=Aspergillus avenaceus TaxID=36643 RepID=A0A5N6TYR5_ASPAV|nr:hypothetical protein BDV25DRAFT_93244 [Aspergillus avenaceus]
MASLVWFITGASSGLGQSLALYALSAGHKVIGTVRNTTKSAAAVQAIEGKGGRVLILDVTKADTVVDTVKQAESIYGKIDVLVNNAGYSLLGAIEDFNEQESHLQFETNFFGPLRTIRAVLPGMRANGSGMIVNVSSIAGQNANPSCGLYGASKFALEGLSEALSKEVAPFGVSVLIVEPGAFRTNFLSALQLNERGLSEPYQNGPVRTALDLFHAANGNQKGDPERAVARIFEVVTGEGQAGSLKGKILRLPLGPDCVNRLEVKLKTVSSDLEAAREVALGTDIVDA